MHRVRTTAAGVLLVVAAACQAPSPVQPPAPAATPPHPRAVAAPPRAAAPGAAGVPDAAVAPRPPPPLAERIRRVACARARGGEAAVLRLLARWGITPADWARQLRAAADQDDLWPTGDPCAPP